VSVVGLGGNNFGSRLATEATAAVVHAALDAGINLFDTADIYGSFGGGEFGDGERLLGAALRGHREDVLLATKFGMDTGGDPGLGPRGSAAYIRWALEGSLRRLGTDRLDLYQYHEPDGITPIAETMGALSGLVAEGKVLHIGVSNVDAGQVAEAGAHAPVISVQARYHLLDRSVETELVPACRRFGVGLLPFYPLANGLLSGKYRCGEPPAPGTRLSWREGWLTEQAVDRVEALRDFGAQRGRSLLEVAVGGLAGLPAVGSVIAGAMTSEQVRGNAAAADWIPGDADLAALDEIVHPGERVV
jgi:aryl-alcohol dehydrogenase-like predicted oxidoreductase